MDRREIVLAGLAAAGRGASFTPVQVQKIFFLLDRKAAHLLQGPHFAFQPYDYGPFDVAVYNCLRDLEKTREVAIDGESRFRTFALTEAGAQSGEALLAGLPQATADFIRGTVEWVRALRFDQLVAAIYREYPEMKANSVFRS